MIWEPYFDSAPVGGVPCRQVGRRGLPQSRYTSRWTTTTPPCILAGEGKGVIQVKVK